MAVGAVIATALVLSGLGVAVRGGLGAVGGVSLAVSILIAELRLERRLAGVGAWPAAGGRGLRSRLALARGAYRPRG